MISRRMESKIQRIVIGSVLVPMLLQLLRASHGPALAVDYFDLLKMHAEPKRNPLQLAKNSTPPDHCLQSQDISACETLSPQLPTSAHEMRSIAAWASQYSATKRASSFLPRDTRSRSELTSQDSVAGSKEEQRAGKRAWTLFQDSR